MFRPDSLACPHLPKQLSMSFKTMFTGHLPYIPKDCNSPPMLQHNSPVRMAAIKQNSQRAGTLSWSLCSVSPSSSLCLTHFDPSSQTRAIPSPFLISKAAKYLLWNILQSLLFDIHALLSQNNSASWRWDIPSLSLITHCIFGLKQMLFASTGFPLWFRLHHLVLAVQSALQSDEFQTEGGFGAVFCVTYEISSHTFQTVYVCFCN